MDKIHIIITDKQGDKSTIDPMAEDMSILQLPNDTAPKMQAGRADVSSIVVTGLALNAAKSGANLALSSVGLATNDRLKQQRVNDAMKLVGLTSAFATLNPAVIGAAVIGVAVDGANYAIQESYRRRDEAVRIQEAEVYKDLRTAKYGRGR